MFIRITIIMPLWFLIMYFVHGDEILEKISFLEVDEYDMVFTLGVYSIGKFSRK
ncbi:hypothetical protein [Paucisalibacillus globulus]|uniref:hypothetical protein n=1 Tax=Paucisalibacillus globulus TaxID=351095 RepID=UPI001C3E9316|nr:hypothetical protein [Paucisalibacillus globulus]